MKQQTVLFAVYGTLKQGYGNNRLLENATFLGTAQTEPEYTMYSLGGFPGVVKTGNTPIQIEVYKVEDEYTINRVNALEGFTGRKNDPDNWYDTETIMTPYGEAEMFVFKQPLERPIVESGKW